jgi:hypothetical protein
MNKDDTIAAHYFEGGLYIKISDHLQAVRSAVAVTREKLAEWMVERGYATGHGDSIEDLLQELDWQIAENLTKAMINGVTTEREECAKLCDDWPNGRDDVYSIGVAIRARGEK